MGDEIWRGRQDRLGHRLSGSSDYAVSLARNRVLTVTALSTLMVVAWGYTAYLAFSVGSAGIRSMMHAATAPAVMAWRLADFFFMLVMWSVMMVAMMLPSATPMILLFERVGRRRSSTDRQRVPLAVFVAGYVVVWLGFSVAATLANWALHQAGMLTSMMGQTTPMFAGALLVVAGVFQWTPLKETCLKHCRSPLAFLTMHWREGAGGAMRMGLHHGAYCVGCCWLLMALLFVLGVMNLVWIAVLTVAVLLEKVAPQGKWLSRGTGVGLIVWGITLAAYSS
jgi:predicted metal-binding membrane protein